MTLRRVNSQDLPALHSFLSRLSKELLLQRLDQQMKNELVYLVYEVDNAIVSQVLLKWPGNLNQHKYPYMEDLYTAELARGKGYATA